MVDQPPCTTRGVAPGKSGDVQLIRTAAADPPVDRSRPELRLVLSTAKRKRIFSCNLGQLLDVLGVNRKTASEQIQVSYRWIRRMVSAGISRPDKRNLDNLERVASHFALPNIRFLWRPDLVAELIASEDARTFVEKFGSNISKMVQEQVAKSNRIDQTLVDAWTGTRSREQQDHTMSHDVMLAALVATGRHDALKMLDDGCKRLVGEAYEKEFGKGRQEKAGTA